ncbi:MAG: AAA family ATPase [Bacteroidales bacterium]|nr:AAA family ATPase [Candidatus Colimorpha pelethequi]
MEPIVNRIIEWLKGQEYWKQYVGYNILCENSDNEDFIKKSYKYYLKAVGLNSEDVEEESLNYDALQINNDSIQDFKLCRIANVVGVNKLKENQSLPIGDNLTIVYGENGAGKSGYVRLLNNAFVSKGDKEILPNVYSEENNSQPNAEFYFKNSTAEYPISFQDKEGHVEFKSYSCFDTKGADVILNAENDMPYIPKSFSFFTDFLEVINRLSALLDADIRNRKTENPFKSFFQQETLVKQEIDKLNADTDINRIKQIASISEDDKQKHNNELLELNNLKSIKIEDAITELKTISTKLKEYKSHIENLNKAFSSEEIEACKKLIEEFNENEKLRLSQDISLLKHPNIKNVGSDNWKKFMVSAYSFAQEQSHPYPQEGDVCILCHQPLTQESVSLIQKYWELLASKVEQIHKDQIEKINGKVAFCDKIDCDILKNSPKTIEWLQKHHSEQIERIVDFSQKAIGQKEELKSCFSNKIISQSIKNISFDTSCFDKYDGEIEKEIEALNYDSVKKRISDLEKLNTEYSDKEKLSTLLLNIEVFLEKCKWVELANRKAINTRFITDKQKELYNEYVSDTYVRIFNEQCEKLQANFGIDIQNKSSKGNTKRHLILRGRRPSQILSEGEQRAIALADFLTESSYNGNLVKGLIFDDPVNSMDHKRREIIAKCLVDEARNKQVIVFTHDIVFFVALQTEAELQAIDCKKISIRNFNSPGIISPTIPWIAMKVKDRCGKLKNELQSNIKKLSEGEDQDAYVDNVKKWCELLRESWEHCVEEYLFNGAIQRFNPAIQTQRLNKAPFTHELYTELEIGMTDCSNWVHDQAAALNRQIPTYEKLQEWLNTFERYYKKLNGLIK